MQEAEQKTMLEHEKLKISELAEQVEQERVAAENAKATAEAEITDELKKARKILGCASHIASVQVIVACPHWGRRAGTSRRTKRR